MASSKSPPQTFWKDDLGLNVDELTDGFADDARTAWIDKRTGRQSAVICDALGLDGHSARSRKQSLHELDDDLVPFFLVEQFARFKSKIAVVEFAREALSEEKFAACMLTDDDGDKTALLFSIYTEDWEGLKTIALLDRTHKSGFAGMKLRGGGRKPKRALATVLKPASLKPILSAADTAAKDRRSTVLRGVLERNGRVLLFLRRAERPEQLVRHTGGVIHGYKPEWIILDFADDGKRVRIASRTSFVPLHIANRIAAACFEKDCDYINDSDATPRKTLEKLMAHLRSDTKGPLTLVELVANTTPLKGSPAVRISHPDSRHIGESVDHFEQKVGKLSLDHIDSVKSLFRKKRVTLIFDRAEDDTDAFDVRYSDHRLNAVERVEFVTLLRETHGITIHSTEKRYARTA